MKIELRKFNIIDGFRILRLTLNKEYSQETETTFFSYLFKIIKSFFKKEKIYHFAILVSGKFGGNIGLTEKKNKEYELGYLVLKRFRNKGIATKAIKEILNFAFKKLKLNKIKAITDKNNKASQKVLIKNKFKLMKRDKKNKELLWEKRLK
jgi:RimJ/RimL family protein N-acetyltransferase